MIECYYYRPLHVEPHRLSHRSTASAKSKNVTTDFIKNTADEYSNAGQQGPPVSI